MSTLQVYSYYISPFANSRESSKPDFHNSIAIRPLSVVYPASEGNHQAILFNYTNLFYHIPDYLTTTIRIYNSYYMSSGPAIPHRLTLV